VSMSALEGTYKAGAGKFLTRTSVLGSKGVVPNQSSLEIAQG
jgi:hypothetical protein